MVAERGLAKPSSALTIQLGKMVEQVESARALAYEMAESRGDGGGAPPHLASVIKVFCSELGADIAELAVELLGPDAAGYQPEVGAGRPGTSTSTASPDHRRRQQRDSARDHRDRKLGIART